MLEVRFFARLREALGRERVRLPLETPGLTVEGLLSALEAEIPGSRGQLTAPGIRLAATAAARQGRRARRATGRRARLRSGSCIRLWRA